MTQTMFDMQALLRRAWTQCPVSVKSAVRRLRNPATYALYDADYERFRLDVRWIVDALASRPPASGPEVLINGLHCFVAAFKEEFVFASLLRWHGYRPVFLIDPTRLIERYVSLIPDVRFVDWNAFDPTPRASEVEQARVLLERVSGISSLVHLEVDGFAIGRNALSRFMQLRRLGSIDVEACREPLVRQLAHALAAVRASKACLKREKAPIVLMNERGYTPLGEFFDGALMDGRRVVQYVCAHGDDSRTFKAYTTSTRTDHPYALAAETWKDALRAPFGEKRRHALLARWEGFYRDKTWFNFQRLQHGTTLQDREAIYARLGLDPLKKTAVIYAHIFWDATFFYGDSLYDDYRQWFIDAVRQANLNDRVNWILKLHPVNVWRKEVDDVESTTYAEMDALAQAGIVPAAHVKPMMPDTDVSSWSLFKVSDYCVTVRGTVGIENAILGKRVIVAGDGHYSQCGFTLNPASVQEFREMLSHIETIEPPPEEHRERALRYAYWFLNRKAYRLGYRMRYATGPDVFHPVNGSLEVCVPNVEGFFDAACASHWVRWLMQSDELDCLARDPVEE
jgi:hypothetical protein